MKPYIKTTQDIKAFIDDKSYDFLHTHVRFGDEQIVRFDQSDIEFPVNDADVGGDVHQQITKAILDGLGGYNDKNTDYYVYINVAESLSVTFYVNVIRTTQGGVL